MTRIGVPNPNAITAMTKARVVKTNERTEEYIRLGLKPCSKCGPKPLSEFEQSLRKNGSVKYAAWCRECGAKQRGDYRQKIHYNLSPEDSEKIVNYQQQRCAICKAPMAQFKRRLATDHDHKTGLIRGKLCWFCNKLIAIAQDNPVRLLAAALYLVYPPAVAALGVARFGLPGRAGTKKQRRLAKKLAKTPQPERVFVPEDPILWLEEQVRITQLPRVKIT